MTAAPDPFRDQLAEARWSPDGRNLAIRNRDDKYSPWRVTDGSQRSDRQVADWLPVAPAAEVARVQAAGEQRAAEVHRVIGSQERWAREARLSPGAKSAALGVLAEIRAALAQPETPTSTPPKRINWRKRRKLDLSIPEDIPGQLDIDTLDGSEGRR